MSEKWRQTREGRVWYRNYMRGYMRKRRAKSELPAPVREPIALFEPQPQGRPLIAVEVERPVRSVLSMVKPPADVWPGEEPAESISEQYRRQIRKPKEQKPVFSKDQIIA